MEDLIFYPGGHPVTKNDFLSLKNRFDKSIFALLESFDPSNKYKAIIFKAEITKANPPSSGPSSTYIFSGTDGYVYHKVKKQIYALNYTKDFATYTNSQGSNHVDNEVACIIFPEDSTYEKEATDPVEYESATNGQGASYDCHVTRTALYGNQLTFPSGTTLPPGYESYTTYDSDQSVSETLVLKDLTLKYNNAVYYSNIYKDKKTQYDTDHKFITSIASNYPNDGSAGVGKLKVNTLDVDNFKIDGIQHDIAEVAVLSENIIKNPTQNSDVFTYVSSITTDAIKQLETPLDDQLDDLLTNHNLLTLITNINKLKTYLSPVWANFERCRDGLPNPNYDSTARITKGYLTKIGNLVTGSITIKTLGLLGDIGNRNNIEGIHIGNLPIGFKINTEDLDTTYEIKTPGIIENNTITSTFPNLNQQAYLWIKENSEMRIVYNYEPDSSWIFNFSYFSEI